MASDVDICNLALAKLGDAATVQSINPPSGSVQAGHCATFYPMVFAKILDAHNWNFAMSRASLTQLSTVPAFGWLYQYSLPANCSSVMSVHVNGAPDDSSPQNFETEYFNGNIVLLCNVISPVIRYNINVADPTKFGGLLVEAFATLLAGWLAGPVLKGDAGRAASAAMMRDGMMLLTKAKESDSAQRRVRPTHIPTWLAARGAGLAPNGGDNFNPPIA